MLSYDVKFITCDESLYVKHSQLKIFKYESKKKLDEESIYALGKKSYSERRGASWHAPRSSHIRQLETKIREQNIIACEWTSDSLVTLVFSSGTIAYLTVNTNTLDVQHVLFDRYCIGKLAGQIVTSVALCKSHILFTHADRVATLITFGKTPSDNIPCSIADRNPHLQTIELGGGARRAERRVTWCDSGGLHVLIWSTTGAEPAPWSPVIEDHANLHLYQINGQQMNLLAYHQLENETLAAELSSKRGVVVHIVEQITCHKTGVSVSWLRYDISNLNEHSATKLSTLRESATQVSLPAPARVVQRSPCDLRLLAASIDGSLHVIHHVAGLTHSTKAGFIATDVQWCNELIIASKDSGRIQCFDRALTLLHHHSKCLDFSTFFKEPRRMQLVNKKSIRAGAILGACFAGGPFTLLRVRHARLLTTWIRSGRLSSAVALLRALDWEEEGVECMWAVNHLVCAALRHKKEKVDVGSAVAGLGAYLAPLAPHSAAAARYAPPVHDLARKLFHHLLRRGLIEKALSLGVDLCAWDLFADARWAAHRQHAHALADEAHALILFYARKQTDLDCSESCSSCSSHSYSDSDAETSASSEQMKTEPPPLPRVSLPNHTVMPVHTQTEPTSTNSIRPLHQYLERDTTIWNTDVEENLNKNYKIINTQNVRFHTIEKKEKTAVDGPRSDYKHLYQTELRDQPNNMYRYHMNVERPVNKTEKNVKFSDTVTIAVMSEPSCPETERELADSLPLCPPHKYLTAFAPHPQHSQQHVQHNLQHNMQHNLQHNLQHNMQQQLQHQQAENVPPRPPKIKVVHFGMV